MSTPINDGGPVFPSGDGYQRALGMTLRDYFAAAALQGILMNYTIEKFGISEEAVTRSAYDYADAMLAQRTKKEAQP